MDEDEDSVHVEHSGDTNYPVSLVIKREGFVDEVLCNMTAKETHQLAHDLIRMVGKLL